MTILFFEWIFLRAPASFLQTMRNVSIGLWHYFSVPILFASLFAPWRKDTTSLQNVPANLWGQIILNNTVSRGIGFFVRTIAILVALLAIVGWNLGSILFFVVWYSLPLFLFTSTFYGVRLLLGM